jgi:dTDP-4-dehydrorhamnose reductase
MKILIIGKYSRITQFLKDYLNKKFFLSIKNYSEVVKKESSYFNKFDFVINCSSNKNYVNLKYNSFYDYDYQIVKKLIKLKPSYIFLSTRKIYKPDDNCKETNKPKPQCNYSKNKLITENKLKTLIKEKLLILRISNVIGINNIISKKKLHNTFIDIFFINIKKRFILENGKVYKDFISSKKLVQIISKLILIKAIGTYNLSTGKKIFLNDIIRWLNFYNNKPFKIVNSKNFNFNKDSFYLNNNKVVKKTKINLKISDLEVECKKISKNYFYKSKQKK